MRRGFGTTTSPLTAQITVWAQPVAAAFPSVFELRLARDLGMTRHRLRHTMPNREYMDWRAYYEREHQEQQKALEDARRQRKR